jgi:hypothetical protein
LLIEGGARPSAGLLAFTSRRRPLRVDCGPIGSQQGELLKCAKGLIVLRGFSAATALLGSAAGPGCHRIEANGPLRGRFASGGQKTPGTAICLRTAAAYGCHRPEAGTQAWRPGCRIRVGSGDQVHDKRRENIRQEAVRDKKAADEPFFERLASGLARNRLHERGTGDARIGRHR